ncbi:uncharacterized protein C5orf34 homolog isoform X2 [Triplophysa dalaica]|uniref:uncharacterized protein C5orf34 homolog isoform X2 n=1 Tax=Triplophysa dalaica TaxID=1582913 RepID=UPI0024DF3C2A|nr:uncharacterized protein C5orf34 homolog isoform X2 [Triplophysa dalaica]
MMCAVRFMVMYVDESVDVFYTDGRRLQLSPCGSEFMIDRHPLSASAHPLHTRERVRQRTRFTISEYKTLVVNALEFRNKYSTLPYLPEELIAVEFKKTFSEAVTEVQWPSSDSCNIEGGSEGEICVCSLDGHAKLILSSSGEEFTVEFTCRSSQREADTQYQLLQGIQHRSTCLISNLSSVNAVNFSGASEDSRPHSAESVKSRNLYTRTIQQFSRTSHPQSWHYPLLLAVRHLESQKTERTAGQRRTNHADLQDRHVPTSKLPDALPVKCPSPHQHRWRYERVNPDSLEQEVEVTTELVKVVWCNGVIYRIIDGVTAVVEVSPGDGSLIRSNGALANYFTHHKSKAAHRDTMECVYYLSGLPPDVPGQLYSVRSVVTRASRILECYIQARTSLRTQVSASCWKKAAACDCVNVVHEVNVVGTGHFKALSDGTAEVLFVNGVRAQMTWTSDKYTPAQRASERWCQISLPDGHQKLVQVDTDTTYQRSVSALVEWCDWVKQTEQSKSAEGVAISDSAHSITHQPITCRSVVSELEKIKRFNFLLENSPVLRSTGRPLRDERSSDLQEIVLTENCISDALQKTSRAIRDINTLLSEQEF